MDRTKPADVSSLAWKTSEEIYWTSWTALRLKLSKKKKDQLRYELALGIDRALLVQLNDVLKAVDAPADAESKIKKGISS